MFARPAAVRTVPPVEAQFGAHVRDVAFCGRGYEHALAGEGSLRFRRVFSEKRFERGNTVGVKLSPEGRLVLGSSDAGRVGAGRVGAGRVGAGRVGAGGESAGQDSAGRDGAGTDGGADGSGSVVGRDVRPAPEGGQGEYARQQ
jgi:hypothetical protein